MENDRKFTVKDRQLLASNGFTASFLGETSEKADKFLKSRQPKGEFPNEPFANMLPPEYNGMISKNLLIEGLFESFSATQKEEFLWQKGKDFLTFLWKWRRKSIHRHIKNHDISAKKMVVALLTITPSSVAAYAAGKEQKLSRQLKNLAPNNPNRRYIQKQQERWGIYKDFSQKAVTLQT